MKRLLALLLALALLLPCAACGGSAEPDGLRLYFVTQTREHGQVLQSQPYAGQDQPGPEELLNTLLAGPDRDGLISPFPKGTALEGWAWDAEDSGCLWVWFTEPYSTLTGLSLTLADYCVVLTLSQLPGVESVEIFCSGHTDEYRSHQRLTADEVMPQP